MKIKIMKMKTLCLLTMLFSFLSTVFAASTDTKLSTSGVPDLASSATSHTTDDDTIKTDSSTTTSTDSKTTETASTDSKATHTTDTTETATAEKMPTLDTSSKTSSTQTHTTLPDASGLDTLNIEGGGNWLLKRKALEDTSDVIDTMNKLFGVILDVSSRFKSKRNKLDDDFDSFLEKLGFDLGDLDQELESILEDIDEERKELGDLTVDERDLIAEVNEKRNEIKQLQADSKALQDLDDQLTTVIDTIDKQINTANRYKDQAWSNLKAIENVLDDAKAEELYYKTAGLLKNIQDIVGYLKGPLTQYFADQSQVMQNQMSTVNSSISSLKSKGIDLKKKLTQYEELDEKREEEIEKEEQEAAVKKALAEAEKKTWWGTITNYLHVALAKINDFFQLSWEKIRNLFSKSEPSKGESGAALSVTTTVENKGEIASN